LLGLRAGIWFDANECGCMTSTHVHIFVVHRLDRRLQGLHPLSHTRKRGRGNALAVSYLPSLFLLICRD
jgi:hypothetical protein